MMLPPARRLAWLGSVTLLACGGTQFTTAPGDGGTAHDATTSDAPNGEVGATDSGAPSDAPSTEAASRGWCATQGPSLLCSDFDVPGLGVTQGLWIEAMQGSGGSFALTPDFVSPPSGADGVANPILDAGMYSGDRLVAGLWPTSTPSSFTCTMQWKPVAFGASAGDAAHLLSVELANMSATDAGNERIDLSIYVTSQGNLIFLEHYDPATTLSQNHGLVGPLAVMNVWSTVELRITNDLQFSASVAPAGGVPAQVSGALVFALPPLSLGQLKVGPADFSAMPTTGSWDFHYDDVMCTSP